MANLSAFGGAQPITPGGLVELGYQSTNRVNVAVSATTQATATELVGTTVVCDGSPVNIEFQTCIACATGEGVIFSLWVDGAFHSYFNGNTNSQTGRNTMAMDIRLTPQAGSRTFSVRWHRWTGTTLTTSSVSNAILRISKIVQQNDGLKPFWTPPLVTQLPSNPTVGDTVIYAADATNGVYWNLYYDGIGTYPWKFVGGAPMEAYASGSQATTSTSPVAIGGPTMVVPLTGSYTYGIEGDVLCSAGIAITYQRLSVGGVAKMDAWTGTDVNGYLTRAAAQFNDTDVVTAGATVSHLSASPTGANVGFYSRRIRMTPIRVSA